MKKKKSVAWANLRKYIEAYMNFFFFRKDNKKLWLPLWNTLIFLPCLCYYFHFYEYVSEMSVGPVKDPLILGSPESTAQTTVLVLLL